MNRNVLDVAWCGAVEKVQVLLQQPGRKDNFPAIKLIIVLRIFLPPFSWKKKKIKWKMFSTVKNIRTYEARKVTTHDKSVATFAVGWRDTLRSVFMVAALYLITSSFLFPFYLNVFAPDSSPQWVKNDIGRILLRRQSGTERTWIDVIAGIFNINPSFLHEWWHSIYSCLMGWIMKRDEPTRRKPQ